MSDQTVKPEDMTADTEHQEAFKNLVRKAVTTPVPESVKREEQRRIQKVRRKREKPPA